MYQLKFTATDDADWAQNVDLIDGSTSLALDEATDATFALDVSDCGNAVLSASTAAGTITKPEDNVIAWRFTASQMSGLCPGKTYDLGCTMTTASGTIQLFIGSLAVVNGGF